MALPKAQNPLDWITQLWNIAFGSKVKSPADNWLLGPIGEIGGISDRFVQSLAEAENLTVSRNEPSSGLVGDLDGFAFPIETLNPKIHDFYKHTLDFEFEVWTEWRPIFSNFGCLIYRLFSRRVQQLNLPRKPLDTARGISSEIITLRDKNDRIAYRVWFRRLKRTGEVIYSGIYSHCVLPDGEKCLKIIFPLPRGSATVVMRATVDDYGNLTLESKGHRIGDPGFYFLVNDRKNVLWKRFLKSFHEKIHVYEDHEGILRADHSMSLYGMTAYELHYRINPITKSTTP